MLQVRLSREVNDLSGYYNTFLEVLLAERYVLGKVLVRRYFDDYSLVEVYDKDGRRMWT